jgi:hypothetical protein
MKRLCAVTIFVFSISSFCFAQIQTGNASYNDSKQGLTISHPSLSFNTKVKVTNLRNNRSTEASVNGRIPITPERIADISREVGDILGMDKNGMTLVQIEVLTAAREAPSAPEPSPPAAAPTAPAAPPPAITQVLPLQTVTDVQYVPVPAPAPVSGQCCYLPFLLAILILLFLIFAVLVIIAVLLRRFPWPWYYYPLRARRCRGQKLIRRRGKIKN